MAPCSIGDNGNITSEVHPSPLNFATTSSMLVMPRSRGRCTTSKCLGVGLGAMCCKKGRRIQSVNVKPIVRLGGLSAALPGELPVSCHKKSAVLTQAGGCHSANAMGSLPDSRIISSELLGLIDAWSPAVIGVREWVHAFAYLHFLLKTGSLPRTTSWKVESMRCVTSKECAKDIRLSTIRCQGFPPTQQASSIGDAKHNPNLET